MGQTNSSLSASGKPFVPLATSSVTATGVPPPSGTTLPLNGSTEVTQPLYTTDNNGFTTDAATSKKKRIGGAIKGGTEDITVLLVTQESVTVGPTLQLL